MSRRHGQPASPLPERQRRVPQGTVPLLRALSKLGLASRTQTLEWIQAGRLAVNGRCLRDPAVPVVPERDCFTLDGKALERPAQRQVIVLHKPDGYVTTKRDEKGRKTIFDLLPADLQSLHAVGRLDLHTSGVLLLTNDTRLSHRLCDPAAAVARQYHVSVDGRLEDATLQQLLTGVEDRGEWLKASEVVLRKRSGRETHLFITLHEGKNRELRRLCKAVGHEVNKLKRLAFGPVPLGDLASGQWRELTALEIAALP